MFSNLRNKIGTGLLGLFVSAQALAAATPIVVTDVTDQLTAANAPIAAVGTAVLVLCAVIVAFKMVRRAA